MRKNGLPALFYLFMLLFGAGCAGLNPPPNYNKSVENWQSTKPQDSSQIKHSVFLVGDVGAPDAPFEPTLKVLRKQIEVADSNSTTIFLGDNVYSYGMPTPSAYDRKISERRLNEQLDMIKNYRGEKFMIPGNHDWAQGLKGGWDAVIREEEYVEEYLKDSSFVTGGDFFVPDRGCPGPYEVKVQNDLVIIALNSQWWLQENTDRPYGSNSDCSSINEADVYVQLEDIIRKNSGSNILVVAHHPLFSDGVHGGYFTLLDHLFPFSVVHKYALLPLPLIGSIYPVARKYGGVSQDISYPAYNTYIKNLLAIFDKYDNIIYAAGHEHNLQYQKHNELHHIVSGSGCKVQHIKSSGDALFSHKHKGFARVNYYQNNEVWLEFWEPNGDDGKGEVVFRTPLYTKKAPPVVSQPQPKSFTDSSIVKEADPSFKTNNGHVFWYGLHYRKEWRTPVKMPLLDLSTEAGGLSPYKKGGGKQTKSLKLRNQEGQLFVLRALKKEPLKGLPPDLTDAVAKNVIQDQVSAQHPYGALIIPKLADAAAVLHTNPKLVYVPVDPALGRYMDYFENTVAFLEEDPNENQESVASLGNAQNLVGTDKVLKRLREDNDNRVDEQAFARARLFDMLVGDWDRHEGQWRWKEQKTDKARIFTPVPEDRDIAFFKADGVVPYLVSRKWAVRNIQNFDYDIDDYIGLNLSGLNNDRHFLSSVTKEQWVAIAKELKETISDAAIDSAVKALPPEVYPLSGPEIAAKLKSRRNQLPRVAAGYYKVLARDVDIMGSDKFEKFVVERLDNQRTQVTVYKITRQGEQKQMLYQRTFFTRETKEIRLFGCDGNDVFKVSGKARKGILVRIIGGNDPDSITDNSRVGGLKRKTVVYDTKKDNAFDFGSETKNETKSYEEVNDVPRDIYKLSYWGPKLYFGYNEDDKIYFGGGLILRRHKFRKTPYASEQTLLANFAPATSAYNIRYMGDFKQVIGKYDVGMLASYYGPQLLYNYFGIGNNTEFDQSLGIKYYRVRFSRLYVSPTLNSNIFSFMKVGIGPQFDAIRIDESSGGFVKAEAAENVNNIPTRAQQSDFGTNHFLGLRAFGNVESVINSVNPRLGIRWLNEISANWQLEDPKQKYQRIASALIGYFTPPLSSQITIAYRIGGAYNFGDYHFYQANTLGGTSNLRGYRRTRFSGRSIIYQNIEIRAELFKFKLFLFPGRLGALGLFDAGRVFSDNDHNHDLIRGMHTGYGGGLWLEMFSKLVVAGTYSHGEENLFNLTFGFLY